MRAYDRWWAVAGGWAIDLFLGRNTRPHADVDVATLRPDQRELRRFLTGADVRRAQSGALIPWHPADVLELPTHEIHATWPSGDALEFLLNDVDVGKTAWVFRRQAAVRRPIERVRRVTAGVPYLGPDIVLLYKAKAMQPKDGADLISVLPHLGDDERHWLASAIAATHGTNHPWLATLARG
jgi:hypothetical protein